MPTSKYQFRLDYQGAGFFGTPPLGDGVRMPRSFSDDPWLVCALALDRAKSGDFGLMPLLLDVYQSINDVDIRHMCSALLTVAGTASCFATMAEIVKREPEFDKSLAFCGALATRGELSCLPVLLEKYLTNEQDSDAAVLVDYIGDLIGDREYSIDMDDYEDEVMRCYEQMKESLGSDKLLVFRGEAYSVVRLARYIVEEAKTPYFRFRWRREFEAATGINCSSWYRDEAVRPLDVVATIEHFLDSAEVKKYEVGVRYFFGHRIPD